VNPGRYNISVINGTTFALSPQWLINNLPVNLTGYSADMQVRDISNNLIVELSTGNGKITINAALGQVNLNLTATQTLVGNLPAGNYNYALNLTDSASNVYQILQGSFIVSTSANQ
jgi:hypothetical protein